MTRSETAQLLAMTAAFDRRTVGEADVIAWHKALDGQVSFELAKEAITQHYRTSTDWLMPAGLIAISRTIRRQRMDAVGLPDFPPDLTLEQEQAWRRYWIAAIEAGQESPAQAADVAMAIIREPIPIAQPERLRAIIGGAQ